MNEKVEIRNVFGHPIVIVSINESFEEDLEYLYEVSLNYNELVDSEKLRSEQIQNGDSTMVYQRTSAYSKDTYILNNPRLKLSNAFVQKVLILIWKK